MLKRVYIDNLRSLVNFEYKPDASRKHLIFGGNGAGKSSFMDALWFLRGTATSGQPIESFSFRSQTTRWQQQPNVSGEIEASVDGASYLYRLVVDSVGDPPRARIVSEMVHCDGRPIFEFQDGKVQLFNDQFERTVEYPFDSHRAALCTITMLKDNLLLARFQRWLNRVLFFRLNPFAMTMTAEGEDESPRVDMSNISAWYRNLLQSDPKANGEMLGSLRSTVGEIDSLRFERAGEKAAILLADFSGTPSTHFGFGQLSEGQKCLIALYMILHFVVAKGSTVFIDEPDNFIALREIQPWLTAISDTIDEGKGQVFLISHHPEVMNQWAPRHGVEFFREGGGPTRVREFRLEPDSLLTPAELVARGWERE